MRVVRNAAFLPTYEKSRFGSGQLLVPSVVAGFWGTPGTDFTHHEALEFPRRISSTDADAVGGRVFGGPIESRHDALRLRVTSALSLALGFHAIAFAIIWALHSFHVDTVGESPLVVSIAHVGSPPPPPPATATAVRSATPVTPVRTEPVLSPDAMVQPATIPDETAVVDVDISIANPGDEVGHPFGVPGGEIGGLPGGVVGGTGTAPVTQAPLGPLHIGGDVATPRILQRAFPDYPPLARRAQVEGVVVLEAVIHRDGTVGDIRVVRGLRLGCSEAAVDALRRWRFTPGTRHGEPVDVYMTLDVTFTLE